MENNSEPYGYTGEWWGSYIELLHLRARWYSPSTGTFLSRDPFRGIPKLPQSLNGWNYSEGNPVLYTDPAGLYSCESSPQQWPKALRRLCLLIQNDLGARNIFYQQVIIPGLMTMGHHDAGLLLQNFFSNSGRDMYLGHIATSAIEQAVAKSTKQWARTTYFPSAATATRNLAVSESKRIPERMWTAFLSNDADTPAIRMDDSTWIAYGGFQLFIKHSGEVRRDSDNEYSFTIKKDFSMDKNYNFAPNKPGEENNPAELDLPILGTVYFPDEWADELDRNGHAEGFTVFGAWSRTEEFDVYDPDCDGNWADGFVSSWFVTRHIRPGSPVVSPSVNYRTWDYTIRPRVGPEHAREHITLPN